MKDWHLALVVVGFVAVDIIMLTVVSAWESVRYSVRTLPDKERGDTINVSEYGGRKWHSSPVILSLRNELPLIRDP